MNTQSSLSDKYLFPEIEPYDTGHMSISGGWEIYYEQCGNKNGPPILFIHGGPGAGCEVKDRRFFDPDKWRIILFDQRGCGRSKPLGQIKGNNTWALVDDIRTICKRLNIQKLALFGGSWGSTLATVFAIKHLRMVTGMVLRGIYLGTQRENDYFSKDGYNGVGIYIPDDWERYISHVPPEHRNDPLSYYYEQIKSGNKKMSRELALYECANLHLSPPTQEDLEKDLESSPDMALLEAHYFLNKCFLEDDYILNNASSIPAKIPVTMVQGKHDLICMPLSAKLLHKAIPHSTLHWTVAGHSSTDPETLKVLVKETNKMFDLIKP